MHVLGVRFICCSCLVRRMWAYYLSFWTELILDYYVPGGSAKLVEVHLAFLENPSSL